MSLEAPKASSMIYCFALPPPPFRSNIIQQGQTSTLMWLKPWRFKEKALRSLIFIDYVLWCLAALFSGRSMIPQNSADVLWRIGVLFIVLPLSPFKKLPLQSNKVKENSIVRIYGSRACLPPATHSFFLSLLAVLQAQGVGSTDCFSGASFLINP